MKAPAGGAFDKATKSLDTKYDNNVGNLMHDLHLDKAYQSVMKEVTKVDPAAAKAVDNFFGAAKVMLDKDGNGQISFGEVASTLKDVSKVVGSAGSAAAGAAEGALVKPVMDAMQNGPLGNKMGMPWGFDGKGSPEEDMAKIDSGVGLGVPGLKETLKKLAQIAHPESEDA